ncbi:M23 family metallopeptidase [Campylobacter sp. faydin G-24]|uniref:M23 family metallopeptidase n=1 Tax=Campylobacter anatolicus TaxID=2829105 RepID=A0ABS5HJ67_9BACT|nr:M23 family metallopeptidase [Campylobacter anatolicus]MBR8464301.1 M23 family metallopeptidase [Campylobacter anatolicus]MBR8465005.1 M23 family metallopeptidase [Campylobacter anatolicus]
MRRRGIGGFSIFMLLFLVTIVGGIVYILNSDSFERNAPIIGIKDKVHWNLRTPMNIKFKDDSGVKFVRISMNDGVNDLNVLNQIIENPSTDLDINLTFPKTAFFATKDTYEMTIEATDTSKWGFFSGNKSSKKVQVILDTSKPDLYILSQSYSISKGGSAAVVFRATDNQLKEVYVQTSFGKKFQATPFYKDGFYMSLVAWPVQVENFSADVIARDFAGNESKSHVRYFYQDTKYRESTIALKDNFLDGKIVDLTDQYAKDPNTLNRLEKMKFVNETLRDSNDNKIREVTSNHDGETVHEIKIKPFYPLRNGKKVADFADHRFYTYNNEKVSESWHMGIDFASVAGASIVASNDGRVTFAGENGIYGLNIIIDHGFGLHSLYAHCSSAKVKVGDTVTAGQEIGNTGTSGLALGDHLHFGILVQGEEVRPQQWMDKKWMQDNITSVLEAAKKMIQKQ